VLIQLFEDVRAAAASEPSPDDDAGVARRHDAPTAVGVHRLHNTFQAWHFSGYMLATG